MIINELYRWIQGDEEILRLFNQTLTQELLESEQLLADKTNLILLRRVRSAKLERLPTKQDSLTGNEAINSLDKHISFMNYLAFCKDCFSKNSQSSLFLITLNYLLSKSKEEQLELVPKINYLFFSLLDENKELMLSFYNKNSILFESYPEIRDRVELELFKLKIEKEVTIVENHLIYLNKKLANQKNPLGIVLLTREWISDTEQFVALILWLLENDVSVERILQTHLLHDYIKYNLFALSTQDNEVDHFYTLLSQFPLAKELIAAVREVSCEERGFLHYSLDGVLSKKALRIIPLELPVLHFSLTTKNFISLHQLFGDSFLNF